MMTIDDETLMAYVDGELDDHRGARVRERLRADPVLRERARIFEDSARVLRGAFEPQLDRPIPEPVLELLRRPEGRDPRDPEPAATTDRRLSSPTRPAALALAASLLLAVGITIGSLVSKTMTDGDQSRSELIAMLDGAEGWNRGFDTIMSGSAFSVAMGPGDSGEVVVPMATFLDERNRYCRSYRRSVSSRPDVEHLLGIACRDADSGTWSTRVLVAHSAARSPGAEEQGDDTGYRPAAGSSDDGFERILESYATTSPLSAEQEAELMESGWR